MKFRAKKSQKWTLYKILLVIINQALSLDLALNLIECPQH